MLAVKTARARRLERSAKENITAQAGELRNRSRIA
jgi:hypothetical protein